MLLKNTWQKWMGFLLAIVLLLFFICASIVYGYTDTTWKMAIDAFTHFNGSNEHLVIQSARVPRAFIAAAVGASLAISGVLMQTLTKNPLASPDIFGVNAGAGVAVVIGVTMFSLGNLHFFTWLSFLGAAIAAISVYVVGSIGREGLTPMKLTLAGAAMTAMFSSFTQGLLVLNEAAFEQVLFWLAGSVSGRKLENLTAVLPYLAAGWIASLLIAAKMNVFSMGEDVAKGLGLNTVLLAWKNGVSSVRLVLIGIGIMTLMKALTTIMMILGPIYQASQANIWITGTVYGSNWKNVGILVPWIVLLLIIAFIYARHVNIQELGDDIAAGLGSHVHRQRFTLLMISTGLIGSSVAFAGGIGFVGLMAPHMARRLVGSAFGALLPVSALLGGILVMLADLIGRTLFSPLEIPAGVFTASIGAPYFIYLLFKTRNS